MSVAAIIVNYNAGEWLLRSVRSALQVDAISIVYVVDNASQDNSLEPLEDNDSLSVEEKNKLQLIKNTRNLGFGKANNFALTKAMSDFEIKFALLLNPDCELNAAVLPTMLPYFEQQPKLGMAGCVIKNSDGSIQATCRRNFPTPWTAFLRMSQLQRLGIGKQSDFDLGRMELPNELIQVEAISGAFMLLRMTAVNAVGMFDETYFMHCEDLDLCKRFELADWQIGFVPSVAVLHEQGVSSQSRRIGVLWNLHQGMLRFFDKFYRQDHSILFRSLVKLGIYFSFIGRAAVIMVKRYFGN